jgi:hypothetical protein
MSSLPAQLKQKYKPKYTGYVGGRFGYYRWIIGLNGEEIPERCNRTDNPDLQTTYMYNQDGSEILRYIRLDIDAEKTLPCWKDENGVVSWSLISRELDKNPDISPIKRQIEKVTLSRSKKGLHILIGIAPLPLINESIQAQMLARKIQSNLITCLNEIGIGADPSGRGLKVLFSTYRNQNNIVHSNQILTKNIENSAKKFGGNRIKYLNILNDACEKWLVSLGIKGGFRLYPDIRLETKVARLFLFTLGMYVPIEANSTVFENKYTTEQDYLNNISHAKINTVELNYEQIAEIMGTEKRNIYGKFWEKEEIKNLFYIEKTIENTIRISVKDSVSLHKKIQRAMAIWNYKPSELKLNLIMPENVLDGSRNSAITSWVLTMKWCGIEPKTALECVKKMVKNIPDYYNAKKSCKDSQLLATVNSVYRNRRELLGWVKEKENLPEWIKIHLQEKTTEKTAAEAAGRACTLSNSRNIQAGELSYLPEYINTLAGGEGVNSSSPLVIDVQMLDLLSKQKKKYISRYDGFVYFQGKYYSLGLKHARKEIVILNTEDKLYFFEKETNQRITEHLINRTKYKKYSVKDGHRIFWDDIEVINEAFLYKAKKYSNTLKLYISAYLSNLEGFSDNKFICSVLNLKEKYRENKNIFENILRVCLENRIFSYRKILQMCESY